MSPEESQLLEERIEYATREMSARLAEDLFRPDPRWSDLTGIPPPRRWVWRTRLRWWWLGAREWVAREILRVELLSDHECEP